MNERGRLPKKPNMLLCNYKISLRLCSQGLQSQTHTHSWFISALLIITQRGTNTIYRAISFICAPTSNFLFRPVRPASWARQQLHLTVVFTGTHTHTHTHTRVHSSQSLSRDFIFPFPIECNIRFEKDVTERVFISPAEPQWHFEVDNIL